LVMSPLKNQGLTFGIIGRIKSRHDSNSIHYH
jgi:hypothetical protein